MRRVRKRVNVQTDVLKLVVRRELSPFFAHRHACTIQNMLEQERMKLGSMQLAWNWLDLNALIIEVVEHMRPSLGQRDVCLHLAHVLPLIRGDRDKLAQVIAYLCDNATKYEPHEGEIDIESYVEGSMVHVRVQHCGGSIPTTTSSLLQMCQIVRMHGGQIWMESIPGEGRGYHFTLLVIR